MALLARARWPITLNLAPSVIELNDIEMIHRFRPICPASCYDDYLFDEQMDN